MNEEGTILNIALNDIAFRTLNGRSSYRDPETTAEAIDELSEMVRRVGLALSASLCEIAVAIRESHDDDS